MRERCGVAMVMVVMVTMMVSQSIAADSSDGEQQTDYQRLVEVLKSANQHRARPVLSNTDTTVVDFALSPRWVTLDDASQEMTVEAWSFMRWKDEHLTWSPDDYAGITEVHLDAADIWLPDVALFNRVGGEATPTFGTVPVLVKSSGVVMWFPPSYFKVACPVDLALWPRDQHNCSLSLGSWAHYGDQLDLGLMGLSPDPGVIMTDLHKSAAWKVLSVTAVKNKQTIGPESHVDLEYAVVVQRMANERAAYIDYTMLVAQAVVLVAYYVPVLQLHVRVALHVLALTALLLCYLLLYSALPPHGGHVPLVVSWYTGAVTLCLLSLLCCVWLHRLASAPSASVCSLLRRLRRSRKVVGTYNTLVEEQPDVQPTASSGGGSVQHTIIDCSTETNFGGSGSDNATNEETQAQNAGTLGTATQNATSNNPGNATPKSRRKDDEGRVKVANFFTGIFFTVTFLVDYIALRITLGA